MSEIALRFIKKDYAESVVDKELGKIKSSKSPRLTNKRDKDVYLVVTYHPLLQNVARTFYRYFDLLYIDQEVDYCTWLTTPGSGLEKCLSVLQVCFFTQYLMLKQN